MTKINFFIVAFVISQLTMLIGLVLKIRHLPGADFFLILTFILTLVYIVNALSEIYGSDRIKTNEKIMWTITFIGFNTLAGILYFFILRPRMIREFKILYQKTQE